MARSGCLSEAAPSGVRIKGDKGHRLPDESIADEVRSWFNSIARAQSWKCAECGNQIQVEDRAVYFETGRCARCGNIESKNIDARDG